MERLGREPGTSSNVVITEVPHSANEHTFLEVDREKIFGSVITRLANGPPMSDADVVIAKYLLEL